LNATVDNESESQNTARAFLGNTIPVDFENSVSKTLENADNESHVDQFVDS